MHIAIMAWTAVATWRWANWRHWKTYQGTMLFTALCSLFYDYISRDYNLWKFYPNVFPMRVTLIEMMYTFIVLPSSAFLFLSQYPGKDKLWKRIGHTLKWILIYACLEWIGNQVGAISYEHGWSYWWSVGFDCAMIPSMRLHYVKPLWAYGITVVITILLIAGFHVPLK